MAEETQLLYEEIRKWSGSEMRLKMKDPVLREQIQNAINKHNEEVAARPPVVDEDATRKAAIEQRQAELVASQEKARLDREAEVLRRSRLTLSERQAEDDAKTAEVAEQERQENADKVARERETARLSTLTPQERKAELEAHEAEAKTAAEKEESDRFAAEKTAAEAEQAAEAEKLRLAEEEKKALEEKERIAQEEAARPKEKIVLEYQVTDPDTGEPLGRPTHLEADNWEEMSKKQQAAHSEAVRYAHRMRKRAEAKPTPAPKEDPITVLDEAALAEVKKDLESGDELKVALAKVKIEENNLRKDRLAARNQEAVARGQAVSLQFMKKHLDYNPCDANSKVLGDYIRSHGLDWTVENLEVAFYEEESKLAPRTLPSPVVAANNPPLPVKEEIKQTPPAANPPAAPAPVAAAAPAVVAPTPAEAPVKATNPPAPARRLPAAGIEPGTLQGARGVGTKPVGLTKQDVAKMPLEEFKRKLKRDPNFRKQLNAIGIVA